MNRGCRNFKKGDIVKGLQLVSDPYKVPGDRNYRAMVKCIFCNSEPFETVLSDAKKRIFDGCGCQKNRSNSPSWKSFEDWCLENDRQDLLNLWDYDLNNKMPNEVSCCTADLYYFKCPAEKHESTLHKIHCVARKSKNKRICIKCNSFAQYAIDKFGKNVLELYWDYDKNIIDPWEIPHAAKTEVWFKCLDVDYHESYLMFPRLFLDGVRCPYCHGNRVHPYDSFAHYYIQKYGDDFLDLYWDYKNNTVDPWNITPQSNVYIYLKCDIHGSYKIYASNFYKHGTFCGECSRERDKSKLQEKVENYIESDYGFSISHEYNCSIIARSPKTNRWLPYDNDILISSGIHLIIEVMGEQHYNVKSGLIARHAKRDNKTPEEILSEIQWRDEYKKQYALSQGYHYLAIPYWTEQDESYKTLIDEKIQQIHNNTKLIQTPK
jgi:hypothetical protein